MTQYLQDRSFYEDLYDLHTIEECLSWFNNLKSGMEQHRAKFKPEPPYHTDFDDEVAKVCSYFVNTLAINRYRHKKDSIDKWMREDKKKQDVFDSVTPLKIQC